MRRSTVVAAAVLAPLTVALTACSSGSAAESSRGGGNNAITVAASGDTNVQELWQQVLIPDFQKANPGTTVKLTFDLHGTNDQQNFARLAAATQQGKDPGVDLVASFTDKAAGAGLLADVSASQVPAWPVSTPRSWPPVARAPSPTARPRCCWPTTRARSPTRRRPSMPCSHGSRRTPGASPTTLPRAGDRGRPSSSLSSTRQPAGRPRPDDDRLPQGPREGLGRRLADPLRPDPVGLPEGGLPQRQQPGAAAALVGTDRHGAGVVRPVHLRSGGRHHPEDDEGPADQGPVLHRRGGLRRRDQGVEEPGLGLQARRLHAPARRAGEDRRQDRGLPRHLHEQDEPAIQEKFAAADANTLRPGYNPDHGSDINNLGTRTSRGDDPSPRDRPASDGPPDTAPSGVVAPGSVPPGTASSGRPTPRHRLAGLPLASPPLLLVAVFVGFPIIVAVAYSLGHTGGPNATVRRSPATRSRSTSRGR